MLNKYVLQITINGIFYEFYFDSKYIKILDEYKNCFYKTKDEEYIINLDILKNYYGTNQFNQILIGLFSNSNINIKSMYEEKYINDLLSGIKLLTKNNDLYEHFNNNDLNYEKNIDMHNNIYNQYYISKINNVLLYKAGINIFDYFDRNKINIKK